MNNKWINDFDSYDFLLTKFLINLELRLAIIFLRGSNVGNNRPSEDRNI
jgi:hypothetical protein